ncbi:type VI secretion system tip protein VgrG [Myxococcus stipitatus]|uniref:type VI secretion system Vgr family protein n=1 Tax=Myxococcus stipitatus TaxID=83455 RepID=UPI00314538F9
MPGPETSRYVFQFQAGPYSSPQAFTVTGFTGREELSRAFVFGVELAATPEANLPAREMLGQEALLSLTDLVNGASRFIHGFMGRVEVLGERQGRLRYRVMLVPRLWKLRHVRRSRIFQHQSVPQIVARILDEAGIEHDSRLDQSHPAVEFCVQYRESDFDFVSRLLEEAGIFYFFEHSESSHVLVLGDGASAADAIEGSDRLPYRDPTGAEPGEEHLVGVVRASRIRSGKVALRDFDFVRPSLDLSVSSKSADANAEMEAYLHPGGYLTPGAGKGLAQVRLEELRHDAEGCDGECSSVRLVPGRTFSLAEHPDPSLDGAYLLVSVAHQGGHGEYQSRFGAIPAGVPFRPPRVTPSPRIAGAQTAIVVGPPGEEIHTDEHGRIKVQFHWDREASGDDKSSCWVRVSQAWAGAGWGALYLPRVGQEVVVRFLEGNPDRPLVVGSVYNGENPTPVPLPGEKTKSTLRSSSSPGGNGFNELQFEDAAAVERIHLHGQKNWKIEVLNDKAQRVGAHESLRVSGNRTQQVDGNQSLTVERNELTRVQGNQTLAVTGNRDVEVRKDAVESVSAVQSISVAMAEKVDVAMASAETVGLAKALNVGGAYSVAVGLVMNEAVVGLRAEQIGRSSAEVVLLDREERVGGKRSSKVVGEFKTETPDNLRQETRKDHIEKVKGDAVHTIKSSIAWLAKELELMADTLTFSVGGKVVLRVEKSGDIQWTGSTITFDGSPLKLKGSQVKMVAAGSQKRLKGKKAKAPKDPKKEPTPVIKPLSWSKASVLPNFNSGAPPGGAIPGDAKVVPQVTTENVPDGANALISIHHCVTGARVATLKDLVVKGSKVVEKKTGSPPEFTFEAKHLPWDPWNTPLFYFRVKLSHKALSATSPFDLSKDKAKTLRVEYWHFVASDAIADTPAGGGLTTQAEMAEIAGLLGAKAHHHVGTHAFNAANVPLNHWGSVLRNSYAYHHASHGNVVDRNDEFNSLDDASGANPPDPQPGGDWRSVVVLGNTNFGDTETRSKGAVPSVPRYLVYMDTCVAAWERSLGEAFIARGTRNYLAFRCYIPDDDARNMARNFYRKWINSYQLNPHKIPTVFFDVGAAYYRSMRPVLMGEGGGSIAHPLLQPITALGRAIVGVVGSIASLLK